VDRSKEREAEIRTKLAKKENLLKSKLEAVTELEAKLDAMENQTHSLTEVEHQLETAKVSFGTIKSNE
jgi:predicted  nucleic acid-binding Zn-ribbon protein